MFEDFFLNVSSHDIRNSLCLCEGGWSCGLLTPSAELPVVEASGEARALVLHLSPCQKRAWPC